MTERTETSTADRTRWRRVLLLNLALLAGLSLAIVACGGDDDEPTILPLGSAAATDAAEQAVPAEPFGIVMSVLSSPRCANCHPTDDRPRQTDGQDVHGFNVRRDDTVQTCSTCHSEENNEYSDVPGAPHWGLAPRSMGWLGLSYPEIAQALLDPVANGGRSHDDLLEHMNHDALVLWAWEPGGDREPPPVPHDEFIEALEAWLDAGAPIPTEAS